MSASEPGVPPLEDSRPSLGERLRAAFSADKRSMALLRIGVGWILFLDLLLRAQNFRDHYLDSGFLPLASLGILDPWDVWPLGIHSLSGSFGFQAFLFGVHGVAALGLVLGVGGKIPTILSWYLTLSLQARNPGVLDGADMLLGILLFLGIFLPWEERFSYAKSKPKGPDRIFDARSVALGVQLFCLWFFAGVHKWVPEWHQEGSALYYALHMDQLVLPLGVALREGLPWALKPLTFLTLALEFLLPVLLFLPWRSAVPRVVVLFALVGLQLGFGTCIRLMHFPWLNILLILAWLPTEFWESLGIGCGGEAEPKPSTAPQARASRLLAGATTVLILAANLHSVPRFQNFPGLEALTRISWYLQVDQVWALFAPPAIVDGWNQPVGVLLDGTEVDPITGEPSRFEKPHGSFSMFDTHRNWAYMRYLGYRENRPLRQNFLMVLGRDYQGSEPLIALRHYYVLEKTLPPFQGPVAPERQLIYEIRRNQGGVRVLPRSSR